ncbi:MAG: VWA domain-containing protein, partial [Polyangiaceae bacterium]|nr:VWA domain-containing protein [Polyangiaceae bacterium]
MSSRRPFAAGAVVAAITAAAIVVAPVAQAQEPAACLSPDPAQWPAPKKPYFMIAFDTSGSMGNNVTGSATDSCGWGTTRLTHGKCALRNTILAYSGQVNFGLMTYARLMTGCNSNCYAACDFANVSNNRNSDGCGPEPNCGLPNSGCRAGGLIRVPMLQDTTPPGTSNVPALLSWVDNNCTNSIELFAAGNTPINGVIRDAFRYYSNQWTPPSPNPGGATLTSPLTSVANGERDCRSVNVILLTDGDETCDSDPADPNDAIRDLYGGFTKDGITWHVRTHVINFAGGDTTKCNQFADYGDDGIDNNSRNAFLATDETSLAQGLSNIIAGTVRPEACDNVDNNCNDCTDEGYNHYCNVSQTCCSWTTSAQRTTCLTNYQNSITPANPTGNLTLLPCTTVAQKSQPANWLCYDPKEICDNIDNNCVGGTDESVTKCGNPLHCPVAETCNGQDDDCDGTTDEGVCSGCTPTAEVCDGCDNDCD